MCTTVNLHSPSPRLYGPGDKARRLNEDWLGDIVNPHDVGDRVHDGRVGCANEGRESPLPRRQRRDEQFGETVAESLEGWDGERDPGSADAQRPLDATVC